MSPLEHDGNVGPPARGVNAAAGWGFGSLAAGPDQPALVLGASSPSRTRMRLSFASLTICSLASQDWTADAGRAVSSSWSSGACHAGWSSIPAGACGHSHGEGSRLSSWKASGSSSSSSSWEQSIEPDSNFRKSLTTSLSQNREYLQLVRNAEHSGRRIIPDKKSPAVDTCPGVNATTL